jgi:hypothetical protein
MSILTYAAGPYVNQGSAHERRCSRCAAERAREQRGLEGNLSAAKAPQAGAAQQGSVIIDCQLCAARPETYVLIFAGEARDAIQREVCVSALRAERA